MEKEKVKPIIIRDEETGEEYTLEFNRESILFAEGRGFSLDDVSRYPMTKIPEIFWYAFRWHHKSMSKQQTDKIFFEQLGGFEGVPDGFATRLGELYNEPFTATVNVAKNPNVTVEL